MMARRRTIGILLVVAGAVALLGSVAVMGRATWNQIFATTYEVPGTIRLHLGEGTYVVYEHTGDTNQYGPVSVTRSDGVTLAAGDLEVRGPDGPVAVRDRSANMTISRTDDVFTSVLEFRTPDDGDYVLRFSNEVPRRVMVARSLGRTFVGLLPWAGGALAGLALVVGGILVLVVRRRPATVPTAAGAAGGVPAQWAPDPHGAHRLRYWDGRAWTDHTAD